MKHLIVENEVLRQNLINTFQAALKAQADREGLQQVLINLLGNALQYMPPDGTVRIYAETKDNTTVCGLTAPDHTEAAVFISLFR